jgi:hypothetical protein
MGPTNWVGKNNCILWKEKNSKSPIKYFKFQETYWSPKLGVYIYIEYINQHIWSHIQYIDEYVDKIYFNMEYNKHITIWISKMDLH